MLVQTVVMLWVKDAQAQPRPNTPSTVTGVDGGHAIAVDQAAEATATPGPMAVSEPNASTGSTNDRTREHNDVATHTPATDDLMDVLLGAKQPDMADETEVDRLNRLNDVVGDNGLDRFMVSKMGTTTALEGKQSETGARPVGVSGDVVKGGAGTLAEAGPATEPPLYALLVGGRTSPLPACQATRGRPAKRARRVTTDVPHVVHGAPYATLDEPHRTSRTYTVAPNAPSVRHSDHMTEVAHQTGGPTRAWARRYAARVLQQLVSERRYDAPSQPSYPQSTRRVGALGAFHRPLQAHPILPDAHGRAPARGVRRSSPDASRRRVTDGAKPTTRAPTPHDADKTEAGAPCPWTRPTEDETKRGAAVRASPTLAFPLCLRARKGVGHPQTLDVPSQNLVLHHVQYK